MDCTQNCLTIIWSKLYITGIFNSVYNSGIFPTPWSIGCIKLFCKKGDELLPNNYRGINLLPIMAKLFTSILNKRLWEWIESNKKINDSQFGFKKNRRTTDALLIILICSKAKEAYVPGIHRFIKSFLK